VLSPPSLLFFFLYLSSSFPGSRHYARSGNRSGRQGSRLISAALSLSFPFFPQFFIAECRHSIGTVRPKLHQRHPPFFSPLFPPPLSFDSPGINYRQGREGNELDAFVFVFAFPSFLFFRIFPWRLFSALPRIGLANAHNVAPSLAFFPLDALGQE